METARTVVVPATNGISGVIAPDGSVQAVSQQQTRDVLQAEVPLATTRTPGVRIGFWLEVGLAALGVLMAAAARLGERRRVGTMAT